MTTLQKKNPLSPAPGQQYINIYNEKIGKRMKFTLAKSVCLNINYLI